MKKQGALIFGLALLAVLSAYAFTFTVKYHEVAVRSRFGETNAESIVRDPGLNFRLPVFVDRVVTLDTRLQAVEPHSKKSPRRMVCKSWAGLAALEGRREGEVHRIPGNYGNRCRCVETGFAPPPPGPSVLSHWKSLTASVG